MTGPLEAIAEQLVEAVAPLEETFRDEEAFRALLWELGWDAPGLPGSYLPVADSAAQAAVALEELAEEPGVEDLLAVVQAAGAVYAALQALDEAPDGLDASAFLPELADRLFEHLLARQLVRSAPRLFALGQLLGVIAYEHHPETADRPAFTRVRFDWAALPAALADPGAIPPRIFGWGAPELLHTAVLEPLDALAIGLGLSSALVELPEADAQPFQAGDVERSARLAVRIGLLEFGLATGEIVEVALTVAELPGEGTALPGLVVQPEVPEGIAAEIDLADGWTFKLRAGTDLAQQFALVIRPNELAVRYPGAPGQTLPSAGAGLSLAYQTATPRLLLGQPTGSRVELTSVEAGAAVDVHAGELELSALADLQGLSAVITGAGGDGFLSTVLGEEEQRLAVPARLRWSSRHGFQFLTSAGLEVTLQPDLDAGLLRVDRLDVGLGLAADALRLRLAAALSGQLGPFAFAIDRLGVELPVTFKPGNAGPFDVALRPLWPTGIGLAIDTPAVSGGGFLSFDLETGRYAGVFELTIIGTVSVKAIAIITTKLPGGGFALLIMITAEGFQPIQLGLGFTLTGLGGLLALNRTVDADRVRGGLGDGVLDSVLFVKDPVRNVTTVLATLERIFPLAPDRLLIGPLAEISWGGSPPLVKLRIALLLEVPQPIRAVVLAALSAVLPREDEAVVELHVDAIGVLDLGRGELALDASLHHSRLLQFTLTGDMALRLNWGSDPTFVLSVGGFHPRFAPPRGLRPLNRLALTLTGSDNPRVRFEAYLAVTPNTLQMGARVTLYAAAGGFGVDGGGSFDALIQWSPFALEATFAAWLKLFSPAGTLASLSVSVTLTGPAPWHVSGTATVHLLFFSVSFGINLTLGDAVAPALVEVVDVAALVWAAVGDRESWHAVLPASETPGATLAAAAGVVHPLAVLEVRQRIVPLGTPVSRVGAARPLEGTRAYHLDVTGASGTATAAVQDLFAPAQYADVPDDEALMAPSFAPMPAGLTLAAEQALANGPALSFDLAVETLDVTDLDRPALVGDRVPAVVA